MAEKSRPWDGTTTGDATDAPYDAGTEFARILMAASKSGGLTNKGFVVAGLLGELATTGTSSPLAVADGEAMVYGTWYSNSASVSVTVPTPAVSPRLDYIVLRKSWAAQTVRITRIAGAEGGALPALTQSAGVTWDFPIAAIQVTTGGVIAVVDVRVVGMLVDKNGVNTLSIAYTPSGSVAATTVAGAIAELDSEKLAKAGGTMTGVTVHSAGAREDFATTIEEKIRLYGDGTADNTYGLGVSAAEFTIIVPTTSSIGVRDAQGGTLDGTVALSNGTVQTNLNADKLDGLTSADFALVAHTHGYDTLNKATGSASAGLFDVNQYAFASPSKIGTGGAGNAELTMGAGAGGGAYRSWYQPTSATLVTWDYLTASGHPRVWAEIDNAGTIISMWEAEDPTDDEDPDRCPIGENPDYAYVPIELPSAEEIISVTEAVQRKRVHPLLGKGVYAAARTPAELFGMMVERMYVARPKLLVPVNRRDVIDWNHLRVREAYDLAPLTDPRALDSKDLGDNDHRNWHKMMHLRAASRLMHGHHAESMIPLISGRYTVDRRNGKLIPR